MSKLRLSLHVLALVAITLAFTSFAQAQATRTWVSGVGDDVNPCSRTAPCKTFAGAISKTAKDGEISVLDPGGFGTVTITKSIYINGTHGQGYGSILSALAPQGVLINITDPADVRKAVRLRSLDINGASTGTDGVRVIAALNVWIEDTVIDGVVDDGIDFNITSGSANLIVQDTVVHKCVDNGLIVTTGSGFAVANVINSQFTGNGDGIEVGTNGFATISDSVSSRNNTDGIRASGNGVINVSESMIAHNNGNGVNAQAGTTIRIMSNKILANGGTGVLATGTVNSDGENRNAANGVPGGPNGAAITKQ